MNEIKPTDRGTIMVDVPDKNNPGGVTTLHIDGYEFRPAGKPSMYDPGDPPHIKLTSVWFDGDKERTTDKKVLEEILDEFYYQIVEVVENYEGAGNAYEPDQREDDEDYYEDEVDYGDDFW